MPMVARGFGVDRSQFLACRRRSNEGRWAAVDLARRLTHEPVGVVSQYYGGVSAAASSKAVQRAEARRAHDRHWDRQLAELLVDLGSTSHPDGAR